MSKLFFGHTRFSVHQYGSKAFKATRSGSDASYSRDDYTAWLYDERRLHARSEVFLDLTVPQMEMAIGEHDLIHVVSISPSLPQRYRNMLEKATKRYKFLRIRETSKRAYPFLSPKLMHQLLLDRSPTDGIFGAFRLDDDDVLAADYFERMAAYMNLGHVGWRVSFSSGIAAIHTDSGYIYPYEEYDIKTGAGLLAILQWDASTQAISGLANKGHRQGHQNVDLNFPTIIDGRNPGWLRSRHRTQDSTAGSRRYGLFLSKEIGISKKRREVADADLRAFFPRVADKIIDKPALHPKALSLVTGSVSVPQSGFVVQIEVKSASLLTGVLSGQADELRIDLRLKDEIVDAGLLKELESLYNAKYQSSPDPQLSCALAYLESDGRWQLPLDLPEGIIITAVRFTNARGVEVVITNVVWLPLTLT